MKKVKSHKGKLVSNENEAHYKNPILGPQLVQVIQNFTCHCRVGGVARCWIYRARLVVVQSMV